MLRSFASSNSIFAEIKFNGSVLQYEVLDTLEFTSDRKRMSIVVRDCQNEKIVLLSKGADEAIFPCASTGTAYIIWILDNLTQYFCNYSNTVYQNAL